MEFENVIVGTIIFMNERKIQYRVFLTTHNGSSRYVKTALQVMKGDCHRTKGHTHKILVPPIRKHKHGADRFFTMNFLRI